MTAALGVILDTGANTQKYFGGGEVENTSKQTASDMNGHTNDILCCKVSNDKSTAATGQNGSTPVLFTWCAESGQKKGRAKLPKGSRGIKAIGFNHDGSKLACVDEHNDHNVYVFNCGSDLEMVGGRQKGDGNKIHDLAWDQGASNRFCTAGTKHFYFWNADESAYDKKKGIYNGNPQTSFACCVWDDKGKAYSGGANSKIYCWDPSERKCEGTIDNAHKKGFICALTFSNGELFSGGKDGNVCVIDPASKTVKSCTPMNHLVRAIASDNGCLTVGLRNGDIISNGNVVMSSHNEGEVWGLDVCPTTGAVCTSGDDNQVIFWDPNARKKRMSTIVSAGDKKKKGASTLSDLPA